MEFLIQLLNIDERAHLISDDPTIGLPSGWPDAGTAFRPRLPCPRQRNNTQAHYCSQSGWPQFVQPGSHNKNQIACHFRVHKHAKSEFTHSCRAAAVKYITYYGG